MTRTKSFNKNIFGYFVFKVSIFHKSVVKCPNQLYQSSDDSPWHHNKLIILKRYWCCEQYQTIHWFWISNYESYRSICAIVLFCLNRYFSNGKNEWWRWQICLQCRNKKTITIVYRRPTSPKRRKFNCNIVLVITYHIYIQKQICKFVSFILFRTSSSV